MSATRLSRFELLDKLGEGGMGVVYAAYDRCRDMNVALKCLRHVSPSNLYRFKREFRAVSELSHRNIVALYDLVAENGAWFLTMELLEGWDLLSYIRDGRCSSGALAASGAAMSSAMDELETRTGITPVSMQELEAARCLARSMSAGPGWDLGGDACPAAGSGGVASGAARSRANRANRAMDTIRPAELVTIDGLVDLDRLRGALSQLADALCALHSIGVVHRDLKPANVLVTGDGRVVLMDFGVIAETGDSVGVADTGTASSTASSTSGPERGLAGAHRSSCGIIGTPHFMAPEQARGQVPTAAADWYAFGVTLYLALTGHLPCHRAAAAGRAGWGTGSGPGPVPPSHSVIGVPADLEALCLQLLLDDPAARPDGRDVLARLGQAAKRGPARESVDDGAVGASVGTVSPGIPDRDTFVGRTAELAALAGLHDQARSGHGVCAFIRGESGMGKSRLVDRFLAETRARGPAPVVLSGRCSGRESLAYKAFDSVIDDLTWALLEIPDDERAALIPPDARVLCRFFPTLGQAIGREASGAMTGQGTGQVAGQGTGQGTGQVADQMTGQIAGKAREQRIRAATALRVLLEGLARHRPVILRIEDVQWADPDSCKLLAGLLRAPAPPGVMVIATEGRVESHERDEVGGGEPGAHRARNLSAIMMLIHGASGDAGDAENDRVVCRCIDLGPLSVAEQAELYHTMAGDDARPGVLGDDRADDGAGKLGRLVAEAAGHPMLLAELTRYASRSSMGSIEDAGELHLEDIIWQRVSELPDEFRAVLEMLALAGEPVPMQVLARAMSLSDGTRERAIHALCGARLLRQIVSRKGEVRWVVYHRRVAAAVIGHIAEPGRRELHRRLARALEQWDQASPSWLAHQWSAAGHRARAVRYLVIAAHRAAESLAMERAIGLYRRALGELPEIDTAPGHVRRDIALERCRIFIALARCLRVAERSAEAMPVLDAAGALAMKYGFLEERAMIHDLRGSLLFPRGDFDGCAAEHARALDLARAAGSLEGEARALSGLGDADLIRGRMLSAYAHFDRCIELSRTHGFRDIVVANLPVRGWTRYFRGELAAGVHDCDEAIATAVRTGRHRAEIVARAWLGMILTEMGRIHQAIVELEQSVALASRLGLQRFELCHQSLLYRAIAARGQRGRAAKLARYSASRCRDVSYSLTGPMVLGALAATTDDRDVRSWALSEGERVLVEGATGSSALFFYRDAMDASWHAGDGVGMARYASELARYTTAEPSPWSQFFVDRGLLLAAYLRGQRGPEVAATARGLRREAEHLGFVTAADFLSEVAISAWAYA